MVLTNWLNDLLQRRSARRRSIRRKLSNPYRSHTPQLVGQSEVLEDRTLLATFTVTNTADAGTGSLRQAVLDANASAGADDIDATGVTGTITILTQIDITDGVTINGPGADQLTVSGGGATRLFQASGNNVVTFNDLTLANGNAVGSQGGAYFKVGSGTTNFNRVVITNNTGNSNGSAVEAAFGTLNITESAIINNFGSGTVGAIRVQDATTNITNTTISGNAKRGISAFDANATPDSLTLLNVTITNHSVAGVDVPTVSGSTPTVQYQNSILADNGAANFTAGIGVTFTSNGNNILDDTPAGDAAHAAGPNDLRNTNPLLDPLELNMGTFVHPLQGGSPAIDAGNDTAAPLADQRGVARIDGDNNGSVISDIGAFESAFIPPVIDFAMATFSTPEGNVTNTTNVVMLTRMGTIGTTSSVDVVLTGGSALAGTDFTAGPITVSFAAGQSTAMVPIQLLGENLVELDETINLSLTNFVNSQAGTTQQTSTLTIQNDDSATISIGDATITEGGQLSFSVSITNPVDVNVTLNADTQDGTATTADSDYTALVADLVTFTAGSTTSQTVTVQTTADNKVELDEMLSVLLSNLSAGGRSVTILDNTGDGTITNDDSATISIGDATITEGGQLSFSVSITNPVDVNVTVDADTQDGTATTADSDYTALVADLVTFTAGSTTSQTVTVQTTADNKVELDEMLSVLLSNLSAGGRSVTILDSTGDGTITNDDSGTISINDVSMSEGSGGGTTTFTFTVTLDAEVDVPVMVDWATANGDTGGSDSAVAPDDYASGNNTLTFAANTSAPQTMTIDVNVVADDNIELDELFLVNLSNLMATGRDVTIVDGRGEGTIQNDDNDIILDGTADNDVLEIIASGPDSGTYQLFTNGTPNPQTPNPVPFSGVNLVDFDGMAGSDILRIINPSGGGVFAPTGGITYEGGSGPLGENDTLDIQGGSATTVQFDYTDNNSGSVSYNGTQVITYTGLEPISSTITATNVILNYNNAAAESITVIDNNDGTLTVDSGAGEVTTFTKPSTLLDINAGSNDSVTFQGTTAITLGAANLDVDAGSIVFTQSVSTTGNADLIARSGGITDDADDNAANLIASFVHLTLPVSSSGTIGVSPSDRLEIDANVLQVSASSNKSAFLRDTSGGVAWRDSSVGGGGTINLVAINGGNITSETVNGTRDVGAGTLTLATVGGGSIGTGPGNRLEINAVSQFNATTDGGDVFVLDPDGGLPVGTITAPGATVDLLAPNGSITDANGSSSNVIAADLVVSASTGINLDTTVGTIVANTTGTGAITFDETDGVTLTNVTTTDGNITVDADGTMHALSVTAGGTMRDVTLRTAAGGNIVVGSVTAIDDDVTLNAAGSILDGGDVGPLVGPIDDGDAGYSAPGFSMSSVPGFNGDSQFSFANSDNTATWTFTGLTPGLYQVAASWGANPNRATNSPYTLTGDGAPINVAVNQKLTAQPDIVVSSTNFQFLDGLVSVGMSGTLTVSLTDVGADGVVSADAIVLQSILPPDIKANTLIATAGGSVGTNSDAIESMVSSVEGSASGGGFFLDNMGDLTIGGISGVTGVASATDTVVIRNAGSVDVTEDVTAAIDIEIVSLSLAGAQPITVRPGVTVNAGQDVSLRSSDDLDLQDSSTVIAGNTINLFGDFGDTDPEGSTISLFGTLDAAGTSGNITVLGGPNDDTILVNPNPDGVGPDHSADGLLLNGADGNDTYQIWFGRLNGGLDAVNISDSGTVNSDMDRAILQGTSADETFNIDGQMGGTVNDTTEGEQVTYLGSLEFLRINGGDGNDTFTGAAGPDVGVEPSFTTTITVDGEDPDFGEPNTPGGNPDGPGDTLILDPLGNIFQIIGKTIFVDGNGDMQVVSMNPPLPDSGDYQGINFRRIESLPLEPKGPDTLLFDFDNTPLSTVTQAGYTSVAADQIYGVNGNTFGWNTVVASFDRGPLTGTSGVSDDLLRDGHFDEGAETFTTDITNGIYRIAVKIGDAGTSHNNIRVTNADTGQILLADVDQTAGEFVSQTFVVEVTDGTLDLTFEQLGGLPFWVVNGLEIRPGELLTIGSPVPAENPLEANGVEETTVQIFNVTPGALVTVMGELDSTLDADEFPDQVIEILSADVAPEIAGVQIAPDTNGDYFYTFRHPFGRGTGFFKYEEVIAEAVGGQTGCLAVDFLAPSVRRFDFGTDTSPIQSPIGSNAVTDGYIRVTGNEVFDLGTGFGWDSAVANFDHGAVDETVQGDLRRDGNFDEGQSTFRVELENGTYFVSVTIGDDNSDRDNLQVSAEGNVVVTDIDTLIGTYKQYAFQVTITDGILDLKIENLGGLPFWVLNGLEIRPLADVAGANFISPAGVPADGTTIALISGTAPEAAGLYLTVTTDQGALVGDASDEYDGYQVLVDGAGNFTIQLRSPTSTTPVTANLTVLAVDGSVQDSTSVNFTGFAGMPPRRFDFNRGGSPTATDFTGVETYQTYNAGTGYGWVTQPESFDFAGANATTIDLYRDGVYQTAGAGGARTFGVSATSGTMYNVRVYIGCRYLGVGPVTVNIEGVMGTSTAVSADNYTFVDVMGATDADNNGILEITIQAASGYWFVNGIDVATGALPPSAPLMFAADTGLGAEALTTSALESITAAAIARLEAAGEDVSALQNVTFQITDLNAQRALGLAGSQVILIDDDGLGHGWFVDSTPLTDEEFTTISATELTANTDASLGRVDLLTVVMHELGHILGHADLDGDSGGELMSGRLDLGVRRLPSADHDHAESSSSSGMQAQELSVAPVQSRTINYTNPTSTTESAGVTRQTVEEQLAGLVVSPETLAAFASSDDEKSSIAVSVERDEVAVGNPSEEQNALHDLFAELTHSELASKLLWEQMEN